MRIFRASRESCRSTRNPDAEIALVATSVRGARRTPVREQLGVDAVRHDAGVPDAHYVAPVTSVAEGVL